jgi:hypothetical protein
MKTQASRSAVSRRSGMAMPRCSIRSERRWLLGKIDLGMLKHRPQWVIRTQTRQTAELQMNLGKFCTLVQE